jgi:hypothetical protein
MPKRDSRKIEFGDFQTPDALASQVVQLLKARGAKPASVVEPTCGLGAFVLAAAQGLEMVRRIVGLEINADYLSKADARLSTKSHGSCLDLRQADFFSFDWESLIQSLPQPVLMLGNPPWVTSSGISALNGTNLPEKSNFQGRRGLDAITGKGNFDIAEWMLIKLLEAASGNDATLAMLVKTSVARRVLAHAWRFKMPIRSSAMFLIDAAEHFNVAASACLLVCELGGRLADADCSVFTLDAPANLLGRIGLRDSKLVADVSAYDRLQHLVSDRADKELRWRSGVKHDCSQVMELRRVAPGSFVNGLGEIVNLEPEFIFPMMKGSDVAGAREMQGQRWMIVPQQATNDDTSTIAERAPQTWAYLSKYSEALDRRGSSIYRNRPRFAVFGVGPYTFAPWKVAICGLYKRVEFAVVGPHDGLPVVFDDTVYHLSFESETRARTVARILNSDRAREFFNATTFWDAKRPMTAEVLGRLDLRALARDCGEQLGQNRLPLLF